MSKDVQQGGGEVAPYFAFVCAFLVEYDEHEEDEWSAIWRSLAERARHLCEQEADRAEAGYLASLADDPALDGWAPEPARRTAPQSAPVGVAFNRCTDDGSLVSKQGYRLAYGGVPGCWRVKPEDFPAEALAQQPAAGAVDAPWQQQLADALDAFWNPACGAIQEASYHGPASGSDVVGAIAQGLAAVAASLREPPTQHQEPTTGQGGDRA